MLLRFLLPEFPVLHRKGFCPEGFFSGGGIDMAYDQVDIPLGQKLKVCLFGQDHPEHGMCLL